MRARIINGAPELSLAILSMATSTKSLQERLVDAYLIAFHNTEIDREQERGNTLNWEQYFYVKKELVERSTHVPMGMLTLNDLAAITKAMKNLKMITLSDVIANINAMSDVQAKETIADIIQLFVYVLQLDWCY